MKPDAGRDMKARLRADLAAAMKQRRSDEARVIRGLVAALDNAEAPSMEIDRKAAERHRFDEGSAEIERLSLSPAQVRAVLVAEMRERERAAAGMDRLDRPDRAEALRAEMQLVRRDIE